MSLKDLVKISNFYGADPDFVLAGGGNTSFKTQEYLYVKSSGTTLADIKEDGFVKMNRNLLREMWEKQYPEQIDTREAAVLTDLMNAREKGEENKRPSVETALHDLFPQKYVVHTHPALVNGAACGKDGRKTVKELFGSEVLWIPSLMPGYTLAAKVREEISKHQSLYGAFPQVVILQNHGLFVAGESIDEIKAITNSIVNKITNRIERIPDLSSVPFDRDRAAALAPIIRMVLKGQQLSSIVTFRTNTEIERLIQNTETFIPVSSAYSPDHIVYCRHEPLFVPFGEDLEQQAVILKDKINEYQKKNHFPPKIVAIEKLGVFAHGENKKAADIAAEVFMDAVKISVYAESFGGSLFMTEDLIAFINTWEAETYRKKISLSLQQKRLHEKIAIITGSAQGFGKGIAEEMAREGANVVIADLNEVQAVENAEELCRSLGRGKALAVKVNVADEASVKKMIVDTTLAYGGLDIFINNAGVLKAGSLEQMDKESFEFVTKVNYTAYFLCVKYASQPMKIQHEHNKEYFGDIIQINSKSGLEGSNRNFAYAGSKFGGIGLTQSFAMELVEHRIKVNSICPGNFFEGPLWSNPENGLFIQYLKAGKVPGAETVEDVKKYYESKVPMGRGCHVIDVVRAILYCVEQLYETGQAIPVTGGQIMLK